MALANYTDLKASVATWLARSDLTATIPDFILLAEARFNRSLRTRQQEARAQLNITGEYVTLPTDFLEFRSGYLNGSIRYVMEFLPGDYQTAVSNNTTPGIQIIPAYFSIQGDSLRFSPLPSGTDTATIQYYSKIPPMALNATNWLLTTYPDAYLYGSIMQAAAFIQDDPRIPGIKTLYDEVIAQITHDGNRARWGGNNMRMRAA